MLKEEFGRKTSIIFPSCNLNLNTTQRTPTKQMTTINQFCSLHVLMESPKQTTSWVTSQNCLAYNIPRYVFVLGDRWVTYFPSFFVMTMAPPFVGSVIVLEVKYTPVTLKKKKTSSVPEGKTVSPKCTSMTSCVCQSNGDNWCLIQTGTAAPPLKVK